MELFLTMELLTASAERAARARPVSPAESDRSRCRPQRAGRPERPGIVHRDLKPSNIFCRGMA